jgi:hypothetical protein
VPRALCASSRSAAGQDPAEPHSCVSIQLSQVHSAVAAADWQDPPPIAAVGGARMFPPPPFAPGRAAHHFATHPGGGQGRQRRLILSPRVNNARRPQKRSSDRLPRACRRSLPRQQITQQPTLVQTLRWRSRRMHTHHRKMRILGSVPKRHLLKVSSSSADDVQPQPPACSPCMTQPNGAADRALLNTSSCCTGKIKQYSQSNVLNHMLSNRACYLLIPPSVDFFLEDVKRQNHLPG